MIPASSDSPALNLSTCDNEPIRTPGSIQPHGFLLCLSPEGVIVQASDNLEQHTGHGAAATLGQPLAAAIGAQAAQTLAPELAALRIGQRPIYIDTVCAGNGNCFDVLAHRADALLLLEFEAAARSGPADFRHLYPLVGDFLLKLDEAPGIEEMSLLAARELRAVTGFGRVMVYQFDADGHGHVLAEARDPDYHSYLGQRFPASDIPRQARELYLANRLRLIQDANYTPARLVPELNPLTGAANDLSFAALRSVSPVHLQYMRNMGTLASMSVSLVVKGKLWGLISCHNAEPRTVPFDQRTACEQLGQVLALCLGARQDAGELQFRLEVRRIMVTLLGGLTQSGDFLENIRNVCPELLRFARADGVAILLDERVLAFGDTPDTSQIRALAGWLDVHMQGDLFHTDKLSTQYPGGAAIARNASGVLALPISRIHKHYILWFRPEVIHTVEWAGEPQLKPSGSDPGSPGWGLTPTSQRLTPRTSFATWRETITATSAPWHGGELELALEFRTALLGIALERAEQMAELAEELGRANKELEAFSYSASHDLRAPLRHIVGFSDLLLDAAWTDDPAKRQRFLKNIKESARLAGKLVDDLLSFSQMGRAALRHTMVDMNELVRACVAGLANEAAGRNVEWRIASLPRVRADPAFLQLAWTNLLSNAVKFTSLKDPAIITIDAQQHATETVFRVADNGAGFNMDYVHKLFGVFQRLHRMEDFQGTGIGLANVRRIVERHGGRAWAESVPGQGATFWFSIPHDLAN